MQTAFYVRHFIYIVLLPPQLFFNILIQMKVLLYVQEVLSISIAKSQCKNGQDFKDIQYVFCITIICSFQTIGYSKMGEANLGGGQNKFRRRKYFAPRPRIGKILTNLPLFLPIFWGGHLPSNMIFCLVQVYAESAYILQSLASIASSLQMKESIITLLIRIIYINTAQSCKNKGSHKKSSSANGQLNSPHPSFMAIGTSFLAYKKFKKKLFFP